MLMRNPELIVIHEKGVVCMVIGRREITRSKEKKTQQVPGGGGSRDLLTIEPDMEYSSDTNSRGRENTSGEGGKS